MKIKFLRSYVGRETTMQLFHEGEEVDINFAQASELIRLNVAEELIPKKLEHAFSEKFVKEVMEEAQETIAKPPKTKKVKHDTNTQ